MICLGIDSGTQSTKTIALDMESGEMLASSQKSYGFVEGLPAGHLEQDPTTWREAAAETIREVVSKLGSRSAEICGIGASGQQHGLVVLDAKGESIRPAKLWCDTSTVEQCVQFEQEFGGMDNLIAMAGNAMLPGYTAPKILWLKQNEPHHFSKVRTILLPHDYLNYWLTGEIRMEYGDASGTALMDVRTRTWCEDLVDFIDPAVREMLPALSSSIAPVGLVREEVRLALGLPPNVVVSAGGGDNMMGAIGTGNTRTGTLTASLGTSGTLYGFSTVPVIDAEGEVAAFCDSTNHWMPLVCTMNVTVGTEQVRQLFGWKHAELEQAVQSVEPGAEGLVFLPYLNGERTPNLPAGSGVFHGLTIRNMTPACMGRAVMEGVTMGLGYGMRRFRELGVKPTEIRLTGGGSNSHAWRQLAADVFGAPTVCLKSVEGAALGAAIQAGDTALRVQGKPSSVASLADRLVAPDLNSRCEPVPARVDFYAELSERQTDLTRRLKSAGYL